MIDFTQLELFDSISYFSRSALINSLKYLTKDFYFESEASEPYQVFGLVEKDVYLIGKVLDGDRFGVHSVAVHT